jgi:Prolyl oligopeptidase family
MKNKILKKEYLLISLFIIIFNIILGYLLFIDEIRYPEFEVPAKKELFYKNAHLRKYQSSVDTTLELWIAVYLPKKPSFIYITCHGWHGELSVPKRFDRSSQYLKIEMDMRGRLLSDGHPDGNGWELHDWIDAVNFVRKEYKEYICDSSVVYVEGGSGAGGNIYGILGKFPDFFTAAAIHAGMSDYYQLYYQDEVGEFIDELEYDNWIGGNIWNNEEAYNSRGGFTTVQNLLTPLHIDHGETDIRVPVSHARKYYKKALSFNKEIKYIEWPDVGDRRHWTKMNKGQERSLNKSVQLWFNEHRTPPILASADTFIVAGYLKTKCFNITLENIDKIGKIYYKLDSNNLLDSINLYTPTSKKVKLSYKKSDQNVSINGGRISQKYIHEDWVSLIIDPDTTIN